MSPQRNLEAFSKGFDIARRTLFKLLHEGRDRDGQVAADLVNRDFTANGPDQLWVADITYISTWAGFLYLTVVVDAWSRRVVGWAMATHLRAELVLEALNMALWQRQPEAVIHHSDQGCQYTSIAFGLRCRKAGVRPSMGSTGDCYDNALCESFFATLECERLDRRNYRTQAEVPDVRISIHRGLVQPPSATLSTRISLSNELREDLQRCRPCSRLNRN